MIYRWFADCAACWWWFGGWPIVRMLVPFELGEELVADPADILENAIKVSGKFGGVAGVLQGVMTWNQTY